MKCAGCPKDIPNPKRDQRFCSAKCRMEAWSKQHPRKNLKPKRVRSRERDRLYTIIHRGESLAYLREQAMEAVRVQAMRNGDVA